LALAKKGLHQAIADDPGLGQGVNTYRGHVACQPVAEHQQRPYRDLKQLLEESAPN